MFRILSLMTVVILAGSPIAQAEHPLDPLSWQEHWQILEVLRRTVAWTSPPKSLKSG